MGRKPKLQFDEIGYWSEIKLEIIENYARAYSKIMSSRSNPSFEHVYIDAFAGPGVHTSKTTGLQVPGSPEKALSIDPPFKHYYFIDLDPARAAHLRKLYSNNTTVTVCEGDCNQELLKVVYPKVQYKDYRRGLCLLDPYGLDLSWEVIKTAGQMKTIDIFLNFPIMGMNRSVLWRDRTGVNPHDIERMNTFWGDPSWRDVAYTDKKDLFGYVEKETNQVIADSFRERLRDVAGFQHVSQPLPMRNTRKNVIYYLFFASQQPVADQIVKDIFKKYERRGT